NPAVEIETLAGIALDRIDGHQLRAGDGVEIGQLETDELDPIGPQRRHLIGDIVLLASSHAPLPVSPGFQNPEPDQGREASVTILRASTPNLRLATNLWEA